MKIIITGGHITPAISVADKFREKKHKVIVIGRKFGIDQDKGISMEYKLLTFSGYEFYNLEAGKFTRSLTYQTIIQILKIPLGFLHSFILLLKLKPDAILSFGGYIALPVSIIGYILHIPIYTHEQVMCPGITNRIISFIAKKTFVTFSQSIEYFDHKRVLITGNPLRKQIFLTIKKIVSIPKKHKPILYITGGNLGAHTINNLIESILDTLKKTYIIIHQVGSVEKYNDFERLSKLQDDSYFVFKHILSDEIGYIFNISDLIITRSGANTIYELLALKKPSILIPLPISSFGEQITQAQYMEKNHFAYTFNQNKTGNELLTLIKKAFNTIAFLHTSLQNIKSLPLNADETIANYILKDYEHKI